MGSTNNSKSTQEAQSQTSYDPDLKAAFLGNYGRAQNVVASNPMQPYGGALSADFSNTSLPSAVSGASTLANYTAPTVTAGQLASTDLSRYTNPYTQNVVDSTISDALRAKGVSDAQAQSQATAAGAFGGSRSAVLQNLNDADWQRNLTSTLAGLRQTGFNTAQQAALSDISNRLSADQGNQGAALSAAGVRANAVGDLGQYGIAQQQQQQGGLDAAYQEWLRQQQYPILLQQLLNQSAGLLPNGTIGTSTSTGKSTASGFSLGPQSVSVGF